MSFIYSNPWTDAAAYGQAMGNTLAQSLVQIPAIRAQMALQQAQLARQGQQDAWEARRMNWEADEQKRRGTAFDTEQTARKLNIEAAQQALAQGQQRQAIVSQIPRKMYSGPMADPANKDSLMNLVQQLAIMQNPVGVWQQMVNPKSEEYTLGPGQNRYVGGKLLQSGPPPLPRSSDFLENFPQFNAGLKLATLGSTAMNNVRQGSVNEYGEPLPPDQVPAYATQSQDLLNLLIPIWSQVTNLPAMLQQGQQPGQYTLPVTQEQQRGPKVVNSQAEYDALPSGALFIDSTGKTKRKP